MAMFSRGATPETMLKKLESGQWKDSIEKREMLGALRNEEVRVDALLRLLKVADPEVTSFAVARIGKQPDARVAEQLLRALARAPQGKQKPYLEALETVPAKFLARSLHGLAIHRDPAQRAVALAVLSGMSDWHDHLDVIKPLLRDPVDSVRQRAVRLLGNGVHLETVRPFLRELLQSSDEVVRHAAIEAMARDPELEVVEIFFDRLPDEPPNVQQIMVRGMTKMVREGGREAERVMELLLPLLAADDERIRATAAKLLGSMPDTLHVLRRFLQYAKGIAFWLRDRSFKVVGKVASDMAGAMLQLMEDDDLDVISGVIFMAGESKDPRLVDGLIALTHRADVEWWVRLNALETLHRFRDDRVVPALRASLDDEYLRTAAMAMLSQRKDVETEGEVKTALGSERRSDRMAGLQAVERYQDPAFIPHVEPIARGDEHDSLRRYALEILDGYGPEGVAAAAAIREERRKTQQSSFDELELTME
ncbi:MAG: HEAT repeat domain-containing protein [Planctomycetota bacterium]